MTWHPGFNPNKFASGRPGALPLHDGQLSFNCHLPAIRSSQALVSIHPVLMKMIGTVERVVDSRTKNGGGIPSLGWAGSAVQTGLTIDWESAVTFEVRVQVPETEDFFSANPNDSRRDEVLSPSSLIPARRGGCFFPADLFLLTETTPRRTGSVATPRTNATNSTVGLKLPKECLTDRTVCIIPTKKGNANRTVCTIRPSKDATDRTVYAILPSKNAFDRTVCPIRLEKSVTYSLTQPFFP